MSGTGTPYTSDFYAGIVPGARRSADAIVPFLIELARPSSVIDVGCGVGTWLATFQRLGVVDVLGVDGPHVDVAALEIPPTCFQPFDLRQPLRLDRRFELVMSLEVAEHLPAECSSTFVDSLTRLGPLVVFSAAIPHQGGVGHVNEQWPAHWIRLFDERNFDVVDTLRTALWNDDAVDWWYAQNMLLFVDRMDGRRERFDRMLEGQAQRRALALVHPRLYLSKVDHVRTSFRAAQDIEAIVPPGARIALADEYQLAAAIHGRLVSHFPERDGVYAGPPASDADALAALQHARATGVQFLVVAWPSFWWLKHYGQFRQTLDRYRVFGNDRIVAFDLRS